MHNISESHDKPVDMIFDELQTTAVVEWPEKQIII